MWQVTKLIKQIRDAMALGGVNAPVDALAAEYARLAQDASARLDSCAAMIEKGSEYQALQLAESEPVLLDVLALLSFAEAREWAEFCTTRHLPVAARFDARSVQALDALYAKGIRTDHPLYRDYRAAVSSRDDGRAIQIVRSIVRLNAEDANARAELARLENKLFQLRLQSLRASLASRDEPAILADLAEVERLAAAAKLAECPEFAQAVEVRRLAARVEAMALAERLAVSLGEERAAGAWRLVGEMLARIEALQREHGFSLAPEAAEKAEAVRPWFEKERAEEEENARFRESQRAVGALAEQIEARLLTRASLTLPEADSLYLDFNLRWKRVESFRRDVPEETQRQVRATAAKLGAEVARLQRTRRLRFSVSIAVALVAVGIAAWFAARAFRVQTYARELVALQASGQVEAAEKMAAHLRIHSAGIATQPALQAQLDTSDTWARDERGKVAAIDGTLATIEKFASRNFEAIEPAAAQAQLVNAAQLAGELAAGLRSGPLDRLVKLRAEFASYLNSERERFAQKAEQGIAEMEEMAGAKLGYEQAFETLVSALKEIGPRLDVIDTHARTFPLPTSLLARTVALRGRVDLFGGEVRLVQRVGEELLQAATFDAYRQALNGFKDSRLVQVAGVNSARKMIAALPKEDDILASLLLPGDAAGWAAAKADVSGESLVPENVQPSEISRLLALRDDPYVSDIWDVTIADPSRKNERRAVYSRGELRKDGPRESGGADITTWTGAIFDPAIKGEVPAFAPATLTLQRSSFGLGGSGEVVESRRSAVSESLARLELNRMTDPAGEKFQRPLLRVFDDIVRDKGANPLFKAFLIQQLAALAGQRPYAWGLEYSPRLAADLAQLGEICGGESLRSMDWLLERKRAQFMAKLAPFFAGLQNRTYLAEARVHRETVRAASEAGLQFGGFFDGVGCAHLLGEAAANALWALPTEGGGVAYCQVRPDEVSEKWAKFSPIFFVPVDRKALLEESARKLGIKPRPPEMPFFSAP